MSRADVEVVHIIGGWLRKEMAARGMTQKELARQARVSQEAISSYVNGRMAPRVGTLLMILHAFGYAIRIERRES